MRKLKHININGTDYIIQAYLKNDFCNISSSKFSFKLDFINREITTSSKETKEWKFVRDNFNLSETEQQLNNYFLNI